MTRPEGSNARFLDAMPVDMRRCVHAVLSPLIEIVQHDAVPNIGARDAVIFTSANGVRFAPEGLGRDAYCVGDATRQAAARMGWSGRCLGETSAGLVDALIAQPPDAKLWHLSGLHTRGAIVEKLAAAGLTARRVPLYDQRLLPLNRDALAVLQADQRVIVPLFSPRTAHQFAQNCPKKATPNLLCLSDAVAEPLHILNSRSLDVAASPNARAMLDGLEKLLARVSLG
ncbi:MAG: uroporphyrinogen-III synthase [Paracoccaceae bacterium]|nr:uroporphyrinogen-III synthase [Paracoccaceae bacterium]